ncbi:putative calcium-binding protein CML19 [Musa acuminata AAA Group]|uniref:putative calcium-binding protein CML19 n=1 Tax=Musa acuminata AAA Group TaxID=214697 RepID=UPI0031DDCF91
MGRPSSSEAVTSTMSSSFVQVPKKNEHSATFSPPRTWFGSTVTPPKDHAKPEASTAGTRMLSTGIELHRVFCFFDEDCDGKISATELQSCMRAMGEELSHEDAVAVVESIDSDGDGLLGFDDIVRLVDGEGENEKEQNMREAFRMYEMEGEGCITPKSLRSALERLGESKSMEECRNMIRRFDTNDDGVISFDEFRIMML